MHHLFLILGSCIGLAAVMKLGIVSRTIVHRFNRRQLSNGQKPAAPTIPAVITSVTTTSATVVFAGVIVVNSLPQYLCNGVAPTSSVQSPAGTFTLTYAATIATHTMVIPSNDPAIRTSAGGYATAQSKTF
jgi:hypothetical protein